MVCSFLSWKQKVEPIVTCKGAVFKQTFFLVYVFNKILIIFFAKLACFSLWTQCSSAHTFKAGQGQQRSCKAHLGVQKWVFGHLLHTHWGAGFWFSTTQQSKGKTDIESSFPVPGKAADSKWESYGGRASAWENDSDLGASLAWVTAQDAGTLCCSCYSLQSSSFGMANPPRDPWWDPCPCPPLLCCALAPHSSPASPASSLRPSPASPLCGHLAKPSAPLLIYPYHHSLIFFVESGVCTHCMRGSRYKQYSGHCHYFSA